MSDEHDQSRHDQNGLDHDGHDHDHDHDHEGHDQDDHDDGASADVGADDGAADADAADARVVDAGDAAVFTAGLTKQYFDKPALAPLDLSVSTGARVSLIGHNGSGKTTLMRMLTGLLEPTAGRAEIAGFATGSIEARAVLSYLADQPVFYDDLSVWEHLEYVARLHGVSEWEDQASNLLDAFGLAARADDLPVTFSRGLRQKAAIAMAFIRPFAVMLIDEPFVGLDSAGRTALLSLLDVAHAEGATLVVATHELSTVAASDRVIALSDGNVIYDGSPADADLHALTEGAN